MKPTRVLWLIKGLGLGGAEKLLVLATPYLDRTRFQYEVAYFLPWKSAVVPDLEQAGLPVTCLNHTHPLDLRVVGGLARFLRERRIDLVHAHLPYAGVVGRLAARLVGAAAVYTEHNVQERFHALSRLANQATARLCDRIIAVSDEVSASLRSSPLLHGIPVRTVPNGVDVPSLQREAAESDGVRGEFGIAPDQPIVGVVNVFRPQKRLDLWIRVARRIADGEPAAAFLVVGDGQHRQDLVALARRMGLEGQMHFPGLRRDAPRLMAAFDVFMLSSIYEGLPVAVLEAMALARPIVAMRVGGLPGVVQDGRHGYLVDPDDPEALADRVLHLLRNPSIRRAMGEAARARVQEAYSIEQMVRATEDVYVEVLGGKSPGPVLLAKAGDHR